MLAIQVKNVWHEVWKDAAMHVWRYAKIKQVMSLLHVWMRCIGMLLGMPQL